MRLLNSLAITLAINLTLCSSFLNAAGNNRIRERDYEAVQEFVNSKRTIPLDDKLGNLRFNGSVRVNVIYRNESQDGKNLRGKGKTDNSGVPLHFWDFDSEFNLKMDYKCGKTYAKTRLQCYNPMGVEGAIKACSTDPNSLQGSGRCNDICLRDAWFGYHLIDTECYATDIEIGRRRLYSMFDSRIQFNERFDGAVVKFLRHISPNSDVYAKAASFVIDSRVNHFGYVAEIGIFNIYDTMIDLKYSWIRWNKFGVNRCGSRDPAGTFFNNSQWTVAYNFNPNCFICERAKIYGAFEYNADACTLRIFDDQGRRTFKGKENIGWYVGLIAGDEDLRKAGDWAFDINYQYVEAQAVPDRDARGIKRGNVRRDTFTYSNRGNTNYQGMHIEYVYAISKCFSIDAAFQYSHEIEKLLGGTHSYKKAEIDFIYSF